MLLSLTDSASPSLQDMAADSLLALASIADQLCQRRDQLSTTVTACHSQGRPAFPLHTGPENRQRPPVCRYQDSDHCPFDLTVVVIQGGGRRGGQGGGSSSKSGPLSQSAHGAGREHTSHNTPHSTPHTTPPSTHSQHFPIHKDVLMDASEVFRVMLGGHYLESNLSEVFLHDVYPTAFRSVLHQIYGCGWMCEYVRGEMGDSVKRDTANQSDTEEPEQESMQGPPLDPSYDPSHGCSMDISEITDSVIRAVTAGTRLQDRAVVDHTLQTLATALRFLLHDLCVLCESHAARHLSLTNMVAMFVFSQLHQSCWLAEQCVRYVVDHTPSPQRRQCLQELLSCSEGPTALDMLSRFITTPLVEPIL